MQIQGIFTQVTIELGRHDYILKDNRLCKHCQSVKILAIEDEMHMIVHSTVISVKDMVLSLRTPALSVLYMYSHQGTNLCYLG
jgi:hypothetical protein